MTYPNRRTVFTVVMLAIGVVIVLLGSGCAIEKFNRPPEWASIITTHGRFFGLNATIPTGSAETIGVKLGWGSTTWTVLPVATNVTYAPKVSDTFSVGQSLNPFDTTIREYLQTGWEGSTTPTPAMRLLEPRNSTNTVNKP